MNTVNKLTVNITMKAHSPEVFRECRKSRKITFLRELCGGIKLDEGELHQLP